jgi:DNA-binding transcriptional LysR family regulator
MPEMPAFAAKHPELRVDLRLEDRRIDLVLEGVDIAIRVGIAPPESTEIIAHRLAEFRRIVVAAPSYLRRRGTPKTPEALAGHDVLSHAYDATQSATLVDRASSRVARVRLGVRFSSNAGHVLRELALAGAGIALLPEFFVAEAVARGTLRHVMVSWQSEPVLVHALHRTAQRGEARVRAFIDHLRATL